MQSHCRISGIDFDVSVRETEMRRSFGFDTLPDVAPFLRIRHLGAFWPHWALHKRKCDKTGHDIVSVFRPDCPYPVWHKDEWYKSALPPSAKIDFEQTFFAQAETLFKQCPIPHNSGIGNENCEFTDDWWFSRNCYLCHSGVRCEENRYCYRMIGSRECLYCTFCFECEYCFDATNSEKCYRCVYGLYLKNCQETAFCYDCRNCHDCMFCFNLRNKQYCIGNKQLSREDYEQQKKQFDYSTVTGYAHCQELFRKMMREIAWHRSAYLDFVENSTGNYALRLKNVTHTFFGADGEDGLNITRFGWAKTALDSINLQDAERIFYTAGAQVKTYDVVCSYMLDNVRFALYSGYSSKCENIFGCCGLLDAKNAILNTVYSVQEYAIFKQKLIDHMKSTGEWGQFFPGSFAPNPYDESWVSFYAPLMPEQQNRLGLFCSPQSETSQVEYLAVSSIPFSAQEATSAITKNTYWDDVSQKPFQILPQDINFCRVLGVPLPHTHSMRRMQDNFRWMPYDGALRTTKCAKSGADIRTSWPSEYDGRILSESEYIKIIA